MSESYKELIIKREMGGKEIALRAACVIPTVLFFLMAFVLGFIPFIIAAAFGVLTYFVWMRTDLEFEYLYLDKEISIDKIMAKSGRKRVETLEVDRIEILAPESSHELDSYRNRDYKNADYSAGKDLPEMKLYTLYYDGKKRISLNLTEEFAKTVKMIAPRKVFLD